MVKNIFENNKKNLSDLNKVVAAYAWDVGTHLLHRGDYAPGELDVTVSTCPDGNVSVVFTDWQGRTVLERKVLSEDEYADTYTVYDLWGNPLVVIPPELNAVYNNSSYIFTGDKTHGRIKEYAFVYDYDDAMRVATYQEPGVEPVTTLYDIYGRRAFITDGNLKLQGKSRYFLYDAIGRSVEEGICEAPQSDVAAAAMTAVYSGSNQGTGTGYSSTVPLSGAQMRKAMYYDTYCQLSLPEFRNLPAECIGTFPSAHPAMLTGVIESVDVRNAANTVDLSKYNTRRATVFDYDTEGREILKVQSFHRDSVYLVEKSTYNPDGSLALSDNLLIHPAGNRSDKHLYFYDNYGRLISERVEFDGANSMEVAAFRYDAIGRAVSSFDGVMQYESSYDIRGALKSTQSPLFSQEILRTDGAYPLYDGRISGIRDYLAGVGSFSNYHYDGMGRLIGAEAYVGGENRSSSYDYTLNGNPTNIVRLGDNGTGMAVPVDVLTMEYSGNQLVKATDAAGTIINESSHDFNDGANAAIEYTYDANGNTLTDLNKGVEAYEWDVDNRLASITMQDYSSPTVYYTRAAGGQKLSETQLTGLKKLEFNPVLSLTPGFATDENGESVNAANAVTVTKKPVSIARNYYGHYIYENDTFDRVLTSTGYFDVKGLHAYVRDWQGNVRGVARRIGAAPVLEQTTFYYPYGMPMAESTAPEMNRCKYSGKEYLTHAALNISDFDARILDHTIPRFLSTDVLSYDNTPNSSYIYCNSDPINHIDVTGNKCAVIYSNHGSLGHIALLAQQLDGKYHYFSFNGIEAFNSTSGSSGLPYNNLGGGPTFDSIEEFMNSKYNTEGNEESRFFQEACGYNYTKAIELDTTLDQDAIIVNDFKESAKKEYNLLFHNCADAVKDSLKSIINFSVQVNGFGTFIEILKLFYLTKGTDILYRSPSNPDETFRRIEEYESEQN